MPGNRLFATPPRPEWVYLALALAGGLAFLLVTPPFQVADEPAHFRRAFGLSEGHVVATKRGDYTGGEQPLALERLEQRYARFFLHHEEKTTAAEILDGVAVRLDGDERAFVPFSNAAIHSPVPYLPQAVGVFLARHLSGSVLVCLYAGRLANLLAAVAVTFFAVRRAPVGKWAFAALALTPMAVSLTGSLSPDAPTNALAFLLVAHVLALALGPAGRVSGRGLAAMAGLAVALGLAKQAYFCLPLCYLMIPVGKLGGRGRYWAGLAAILAATAAAVAGWAAVVRNVYSPADPTFGMNPAEQLRLMARDPLEFLRVLGRTTQFLPLYVEEFVGWMGFADIRLPTWVYVVDLALLVAVFAIDFGPRSGVRPWQAAVALGVDVLVVLSVVVIMHLTWDAVGAKNVSLQGRYFIPAGPLAALALGRFLGGVAPAALGRLARVVPAAVVAATLVVLPSALERIHARFFADGPEAAAERAYVRGKALEQTPGQEQAAREQFAEAIRLVPNHVPARYALVNLLARQGDYAEVIRLAREIVAIDPEDANAKGYLTNALQAQKALDGVLRRIPPVLYGLVRANGLAEDRRPPEVPAAGTYLRPVGGRVVDATGQPPFRAEFVWRCPPPSGAAVCLSGPAADGHRSRPFFACSAAPMTGTRRVFVFPPPVNAVLLADDAVSWYYQRPLADLSPAERQREADYRRQRDLHFPLAAVPE